MKKLATSIGDDATEVVFSFDTTGSMHSCIGNVRSHVTDTVKMMFDGIENLKVGLIAHGDYCDGGNCLNVLDLTNDQKAIVEFVRNAPNTSGGDADECYELVLNKIQKLSWSEGKGKTVVMIGDAAPHPINYFENTQQLDWIQELRKLKDMGIRVYPLQCMRYHDSKTKENDFWEMIAEISQTVLLKLDDFGTSANTISAIAHASAGSVAYGAYRSKMASAASVSSSFSATMNLLDDEAKVWDKIRTETESK